MAGHTFVLGSTWEFQDVQNFFENVESNPSFEGMSCSFDGLKKQFRIRCSLEQREDTAVAFMQAVTYYAEAELESAASNIDPLDLPRVSLLPAFKGKTESQALYKAVDAPEEHELTSAESLPRSSLIVHETFKRVLKVGLQSTVSRKVYTDALLSDIGDLMQSRIELSDNDLHIFSDSERKLDIISKKIATLEDKYISEKSLPSAYDFFFDETEASNFFRFKLTKRVIDHLVLPGDALLIRHYELDMVKWDATSRQYVMEPPEFHEPRQRTCSNLWPAGFSFAFGDSNRASQGLAVHLGDVEQSQITTPRGYLVSLWAQHVDNNPMDAFSNTTSTPSSSMVGENYKKTTRYARGTQNDQADVAYQTMPVPDVSLPMPSIEPALEPQAASKSFQETILLPRIIRSHPKHGQTSFLRRYPRPEDLIEFRLGNQDQLPRASPPGNQGEATPQRTVHGDFNSKGEPYAQFVTGEDGTTFSKNLRIGANKHPVTLVPRILCSQRVEGAAISQSEVAANLVEMKEGYEYDRSHPILLSRLPERIESEDEIWKQKYQRMTSLLSSVSALKFQKPGLFPQVWKCLARMIETAKYQYRSQVSLRIELGKVFIEAGSVSEEWRCSRTHPAKAFKPEVWPEIFRMHKSRGHASTIFSPKIPNTWERAEYMVDLMDTMDESSLGSLIQSSSLRQETCFFIHCRDDITEDEIILEIKQNGEVLTYEQEEQLGRVHIHFPKHVWDVSFTMSCARKIKSKGIDRFQCIVDNLWIRGPCNANEFARPVMMTRTNSKTIKIASVELRRIATFQTSERLARDTYVHLTQVQRLQVDGLSDGEYHIRSAPEELSIANGDSWWETTISSGQINKMFRDNNLRLEAGEVAPYEELDLSKESAARMLDVAVLLVPKADSIGPPMHVRGESGATGTSSYLRHRETKAGGISAHHSENRPIP